MLVLDNLVLNRAWGRWLKQVGRKDQIKTREESSMEPVVYTYQDKPYMFARYGKPTQGDIFVSGVGDVISRTTYGPSNDTRMILKPKEVFHIVDGVTFKEGSMESSVEGHWYYDCGRVVVGRGTGNQGRRLHPVSLA